LVHIFGIISKNMLVVLIDTTDALTRDGTAAA